MLEALREAVQSLACSVADPMAALDMLREQMPRLLHPGSVVDDEIGAAIECAVTEYYLNPKPPPG